MSDGQTTALGLDVYRSAAVVSYYAGLAYITPGEQFLFDRYIDPAASVLDLGVGGGRTTTYLAARSSRYVGIDYSAEMISACREKFPDLEFAQRDASDLSCFADASFSAAVMAFNGLDYLSASARARCLREIARTLKPGGVFIFSSHNPRSLFVRPSWNRDRVRELAASLSGSNPFLRSLLSALITAAAIAKAVGRAAWSSFLRLAQRLTKAAFWRGEGYILDSAHGGLLTHYALPDKVKVELESSGFRLREMLGNDFPRAGHQFSTDWYYYVFSKSDPATGGPACAS